MEMKVLSHVLGKSLDPYVTFQQMYWANTRGNDLIIVTIKELTLKTTFYKNYCGK